MILVECLILVVSFALVKLGKLFYFVQAECVGSKDSNRCLSFRRGCLCFCFHIAFNLQEEFSA